MDFASYFAVEWLFIPLHECSSIREAEGIILRFSCIYMTEWYFSHADLFITSDQDSSEIRHFNQNTIFLFFPPSFKSVLFFLRKRSKTLSVLCLCVGAEWSSWLTRRSVVSAWTESLTSFCPVHTASVRNALINGEMMAHKLE